MRAGLKLRRPGAAAGARGSSFATAKSCRAARVGRSKLAVSEPGNYRVEAWLNVAGEDRIWILSNPLYIRQNSRELTACPARDDWRSLYPFESHWMSIDGHRYHYLDEGDGPALLLVHGNPTWSFYWREMVLAFAAGIALIVPDHIGCGLSDKPDARAYTATGLRSGSTTWRNWSTSWAWSESRSSPTTGAGRSAWGPPRPCPTRFARSC